MTLLIIGILLFVGVHFVPSLAPDFKAAWLEKMGEGGYKGTFSLLVLASFALIIFGWKSIEPSPIFRPNPLGFLKHPKCPHPVAPTQDRTTQTQIAQGGFQFTNKIISLTPPSASSTWVFVGFSFSHFFFLSSQPFFYK